MTTATIATIRITCDPHTKKSQQQPNRWTVPQKKNKIFEALARSLDRRSVKKQKKF